MNKTTLIVRILFGLIFFVFGLNGFLNFIPTPPSMPEKVTAFMTGLMASGYFFPLLKGTEVVCGILLLANRFVPLALVILAPIVLNIVMVHTVLDTSGLPVAIAVLAMELYLAFIAKPYSDTIKSLFRARS